MTLSYLAPILVTMLEGALVALLLAARHLRHQQSQVLRVMVRRASVLSSGTVGAALEGVLAGRKAIAISFPFFRGFSNWSKAEVIDAIQVFLTLSVINSAFCCARRVCVDVSQLCAPGRLQEMSP